MLPSALICAGRTKHQAVLRSTDFSLFTRHQKSQLHDSSKSNSLNIVILKWFSPPRMVLQFLNYHFFVKQPLPFAFGKEHSQIPEITKNKLELGNFSLLFSISSSVLSFLVPLINHL